MSVAAKGEKLKSSEHISRTFKIFKRGPGENKRHKRETSQMQMVVRGGKGVSPAHGICGVY